MKRSILILSILTVFIPALFAHEVRPAYLELQQSGPETFDLLWKVPGNGNMRLGIYVVLPAGCVNLSSPRINVQRCHSERYANKVPGRIKRKDYSY